MRKVVVAIAQDLEDLYYAVTKHWSINNGVIEAALASGWTSTRAWIDDRVERRLRMGDSDAAKLLIAHERTRLANGRDFLHTRAEEYAILAQFCTIHHEPREEVQAIAFLAARNHITKISS
ncbi:hypothetical protein [Nannocystis punicea]|uniref:Uncharacterized protein n=1 Tax=Nannocystis punicea TaxID=2995304 RepID=A0ABY7GYC7_9BACT|nr:hypothetical protein [Nannocystis poenicansa]WAS91938.1 hypothetical protein O0S08_37630 [Nannocystis poenicansa]